MKFTLSWLKDHLDTDADASTIADKLTSIGLEVESVEDSGARLKDFIVAYVISAEKHPNADKLKLCMVDDGSGSPIQVVCGAPNAHTGMKGVFARPGVVIPASGDVLKIGTIRGVESRGMLCSGRELLLSEDHDGIIELQADAMVGEPAAKALGLNDPVIDVAITPNRGDCTSVYGIARDLAAAGLGRLKTQPVKPVTGKFPSPKRITLNFPPETASACPLFSGRMVRGVKNGPSPKWVQDRLKSIGLRPISALVDVSNLIAHDRGRPLHVFDADKLSGNMQARLAKAGEQILALDGKTYTLDSEMCVIADDAAARGIAGVMGGEDTGCSDTTTNVFIESALFDPVRTAATGRKLQLQSEARYRFERGVDPNFVLPGLELATQLILDWCGGEASETVVAGTLPPAHSAIEFSADAVKQLGGSGCAERRNHPHFDQSGIRGDGRRDDGSNAAVVARRCGRVSRSGRRSSSYLRTGARAVGGDVAAPCHCARRSDPGPTSHQNRTPYACRPRLQRDDFVLLCSARPCRFVRRRRRSPPVTKIPSPPIWTRCALRLLPSLLAAAQRNQARGFSDLMLFEIGAAFAERHAGRSADR